MRISKCVCLAIVILSMLVISSSALTSSPKRLYDVQLDGSGFEINQQPIDIVVDEDGNTYIVGTTTSTDIPTTQGVYQEMFNGGDTDIVVSKLDPQGQVIFTTYVGGSDGDWGYGIAVDEERNVYITGTSSSLDIATAPGAFLLKLSPDGSQILNARTFGDGEGMSVNLDNEQNIYIAGNANANNFVTTAQAFQGSYGGSDDAFLIKLSPSWNLQYATYIGGSGSEGMSIGSDMLAVDENGVAVVTGATTSVNLPMQRPLAGQGTFNGGASDAFVAMMDTNVDPQTCTSGSIPTVSCKESLLFSTYLGGSEFDRIEGVAIDEDGIAYVIGTTESPDLPTTPSVLQEASIGAPNNPGTFKEDAFIAKLDWMGSLILYLTYLGGNDREHGRDIAVDFSGNAYVTGFTASTDFPIVNDLNLGRSQPGAAYLTKLDSTGSTALFSTYLGVNHGSGDSIALDINGNASVFGGIGHNESYFVTKIRDS